MPRITPALEEGTWIHRIMSHCPPIRAKWRELDASLRFDGVLDAELTEEVRRSLASEIGCEFCATVAGPPSERPDERTSVAIGYAQLLTSAPADVAEGSFDLLRQHFTEQEIVELTCWILFVAASQGFGAVMQVPAATEAESESYAEYRSSGRPMSAAPA